MQIHPYLNFAGTCREALTFYHSVLGGELSLMAHKETPAAEHVSEDMQDQIMHGALKVGEGLIMASDAPMAGANSFTGTYISLHPKTIEEAEAIFAGLSAGGQVEMELAPTFWGQRFGMLVDKFGVKWMINCE